MWGWGRIEEMLRFKPGIMSPNRFERWRRMRQRARLQFTLVYGLPSGMIFASTMAGVFAAHEGSSSLAGTLWMFVLGGLAFGFLITQVIWFGSEQDFQLTTAKGAGHASNPSTPAVQRTRRRKTSTLGVVLSVVVLLVVLCVLSGLSFLIMHVAIGLPYWSVPLPVVFLVLAAISQPPDLMDLLFRLEMTFGIKLKRSTLGFWNPPTRDDGNSPIGDMTAGQLHDRICAILREEGSPVPKASWRKTQLALAKGAGVNPWSITRETLIRKELKFS